MSKILHICNAFDPAADVVRCVNELKRYSKHEHEMVVFENHPNPSFDYETAALQASRVNKGIVANLLEWADAAIYHFVGWERGFGLLKKPCAFRNLNIYFDNHSNKFWSSPQYNATDLGEYKILASSHLGAQDFLPGCRILPDLIPINSPLYLPNAREKEPCISYLKHGVEIDAISFGEVKRLGMIGSSHSKVLFERKTRATVVIDNISDGHYGIAGLEALSQGIATVVFNHKTTRDALKLMADEYPPFIESPPNIGMAVSLALSSVKDAKDIGKQSRNWMKKYYNSYRLIERYWDTFCTELTQ